MTRELLILRHGKSDWGVDVDDFQRPLKDRGKRGAQRMGVYLWQNGLRPDLIITSPAERALTTAEKCCKAMGMGTDVIHTASNVYEAEVEDLLSVLGDRPPDARRIMLVGHNPGLQLLLIYLTGNHITIPKDGKLLPTATLAHLSMPEDWHQLNQGCGQLAAITRPHGLPEKFPYPAPDGPEVRDRPAYYYTQSSVIPYRFSGGKLEILVILSSQKKHFVVPKGIKDPGLSPQESAAKEAFEEAGVEGRVGNDLVGTYQTKKWGATCSVGVYPMQVTRVIPEQEWEESQRGRQWVSPEEAAKRLKQPELAQMVGDFAKQLST